LRLVWVVAVRLLIVGRLARQFLRVALLRAVGCLTLAVPLFRGRLIVGRGLGGFFPESDVSPVWPAEFSDRLF
jgi:hypothetical protein